MKIEKKLQNPHPTDYNLLIVQDSWHYQMAHYQILLIILLREFIKLNLNTGTIIKNVKPAELNAKIGTAFLNS